MPGVLTRKCLVGPPGWIVCIWWSLLPVSFCKPTGAYAFNWAFPWVPYLGQRMQLSLKRKMSPFLRGTLCFAVLSPFFLALGISATSEDIPNKIEDLRSECSSDFGGKDSVTSPDGEESVHGRKIPSSSSEPSVRCHFIGKHSHLLSHWTALISAFSHTVKWLCPIRLSLVMILSVLYLKCRHLNQEISV